MHNVEFQSESEFEKQTRIPMPDSGSYGDCDHAKIRARSRRTSKVRRIELHEVKALNKHLARLRDEFDLRADVLLPREVTGDEPPPRFILQRDGEIYPLLDLRALVSTVRKLVRRG